MRGLPQLLIAGALLVGAGALAQERPVRPAGLAREAKDAPPAVAALFRDLAGPADEVVLADGSLLTVAPWIIPGKLRSSMY